MASATKSSTSTSAPGNARSSCWRRDWEADQWPMPNFPVRIRIFTVFPPFHISV